MTVRIMIQGSFTDYEAFSGLAKRLCEYMDANEPDVLAYEWFADETSGTCVIHDLYASESAFLAHFQGLQERGDLDEILDVMDITAVTSLNRVHSDEVKAVAEQFGATMMHGIAGMTR